MAEGMELKELDRAAMGRRIRQRREVLGMSREDLARRLDVTSKFIADLEYGDKGTSVKNLYRLKQILGLSVDYLMDGDRSDLTEEEPRRLLNENIMGYRKNRQIFRYTGQTGKIAGVKKHAFESGRKGNGIRLSLIVIISQSNTNAEKQQK